MAFSKAQKSECISTFKYFEKRSLVDVIPKLVVSKTIQVIPSEKHEDDVIRFITNNGGYIIHKPFDTNGSNYCKEKSAPCGVFLADAEKEPVFAVTEGTYDALSLKTVGIPALALLGTGNRYFYDLLDHISSQNHVILLCLDNDPAGRGGSAKLQNKIAEKGFRKVYDVTKYLCPQGYGNLKDPNDFLVNREEEFEKNAAFVMAEAQKAFSGKPSALDEGAPLPPTLDQNYEEIIREIQTAGILQTGISGLDQRTNGGLRNGTTMTVIGAPGAGKTGLALFMVPAFVRQGQDVFICTYDMAEAEIIQRMIALQVFKQSPDCSLSYSDLSAKQRLSEKQQAAIDSAVRTLKEEIFPHIRMVDQNEAMFADDLEQMAKVCFLHGKKAVFLIDYIQLLRCRAYASDDRARIDAVCETLHRISKTYGCTVIAVSESGKQYYSMDKAHAKIAHGQFYGNFDLGSPKGSGKIEYLSDVCLTIEPNPENARECFLTLLKNRFGRSNVSFPVEYNLASGYWGNSMNTVAEAASQARKKNSHDAGKGRQWL